MEGSVIYKEQEGLEGVCNPGKIGRVINAREMREVRAALGRRRILE